jgi:hypothetical protein
MDGKHGNACPSEAETVPPSATLALSFGLLGSIWQINGLNSQASSRRVGLAFRHDVHGRFFRRRNRRRDNILFHVCFNDDNTRVSAPLA